jgi:hypothetical protein
MFEKLFLRSQSLVLSAVFLLPAFSIPDGTLKNSPASSAEIRCEIIKLNSEYNEGIQNFVTRLYKIALGREPDSKGFDDWCRKLFGGDTDGATIAEGFLWSQEFLSKQTDDSTYLTYLYRIFFDREPDADGFQSWLKKLSEGSSRKDILSGFINSVEWANVCVRFGIKSGGNALPTVTPPISEGIRIFVNSLYEDCLGRKADALGFEQWSSDLAAMRITGKRAAYGFFFSPEFLDRASKMSSVELVTVYYKVFLNRTPDPDGLAHWVRLLEWGAGCSDLFAGFSDSNEFKLKCTSYGIVCGETIPVPTSSPEEEYVKFAEEHFKAGIEIMDTTDLVMQDEYTLYNVQGPSTTSSTMIISDTDKKVIENFAATHFGSDWTASQKAAYTLYWINRNVTYAGSPEQWDMIDDKGFADAIFTYRLGQCAQYNGALVELLCLLGFDADLVQGYRGREATSTAQHFWGEVTISGITYVMEAGNYGDSGEWCYFCVPYGETTKYIKNGQLMS